MSVATSVQRSGSGRVWPWADGMLPSWDQQVRRTLWPQLVRQQPQLSDRIRRAVAADLVQLWTEQEREAQLHGCGWLAVRRSVCRRFAEVWTADAASRRARFTESAAGVAVQAAMRPAADGLCRTSVVAAALRSTTGGVRRLASRKFRVRLSLEVPRVCRQVVEQLVDGLDEVTEKLCGGQGGLRLVQVPRHVTGSRPSVSGLFDLVLLANPSASVATSGGRQMVVADGLVWAWLQAATSTRRSKALDRGVLPNHAGVSLWDVVDAAAAMAEVAPAGQLLADAAVSAVAS